MTPFEVVEPRASSARRHILVIEPHADDAALSVGGTMWMRRDECAFTVATMASRSNYSVPYETGPGGREIAQVADARRRESESFCGMIGGEHLELGLTDAVLRYRDEDWPSGFIEQHRWSIAAITRRWPGAEEWQRWMEAAGRLFGEHRADEVWLPLGIWHIDHLLAAWTCLAALAHDRTPIDATKIRLYQDVPYAIRSAAAQAQSLAALRRAGVVLREGRVSLGPLLTVKRRLVSCYASQFDLAAMWREVEANAKSHGAGDIERFWQVESLPHRIDPELLHALLTAPERAKAAAWARRNRQARQLSVLLLAPTGRWRADIARLRERFPTARLDVHALPGAQAEAAESAMPGVTLSVLEPRWSAWAGLAARQALQPGTPVLIHHGDARSWKARWLERLWPARETLRLGSMDCLVPSGLSADSRSEAAQSQLIGPPMQRRAPRVLAIIVNYRSAHLTIACLRSIASEAAVGGPVIRVTVVENASGDAATLARAIRDNGWGSWVSLIAAERNGGFSYGNNRAMEAALRDDPPDYFLLINPDAEVRRGAIRHLVDYLEGHPGVGIAGSSFESPEGVPWPTAFRFPSFLSQLEEGMRFGPVSRLLRRWVVAMTMGSEPAEVDWVCGASMMIRRQVVEDIGLMDERYFLYFEEVDYCLNARRAGWVCHYVPRSRVMHIAGQSTGVTAADRLSKPMPAYWFASRSHYFVKNHGLAYARLCDLVFGIGLSLWTLRCRVTRRPDVHPLGMLRDFWRTSILFRRGVALMRQAQGYGAA